MLARLHVCKNSKITQKRIPTSEICKTMPNQVQSSMRCTQTHAMQPIFAPLSPRKHHTHTRKQPCIHTYMPPNHQPAPPIYGSSTQDSTCRQHRTLKHHTMHHTAWHRHKAHLKTLFRRGAPNHRQLQLGLQQGYAHMATSPIVCHACPHAQSKLLACRNVPQSATLHAGSHAHTHTHMCSIAGSSFFRKGNRGHRQVKMCNG